MNTLEFLKLAVEDPAGARAANPAMTPLMMSLGLIPDVDKQQKWTYQLADGESPQLRLSSGHSTAQFKMPKGFEGKAERLSDEQDIGQGRLGTAQIHRAGKDMIYFTMQDGRENRTILLKKSPEGDWVAKVKPPKFSVKKADEESDFASQQASETAQKLEGDPFYEGGQTIRNLADRALASRPAHWLGKILLNSPAASAGIGGVLGAGIGAGTGAGLSFLGHEKRLSPSDNAIRLGGLGGVSGAALAYLASKKVQELQGLKSGAVKKPFFLKKEAAEDWYNPFTKDTPWSQPSGWDWLSTVLAPVRPAWNLLTAPGKMVASGLGRAYGDSGSGIDRNRSMAGNILPTMGATFGGFGRGAVEGAVDSVKDVWNPVAKSLGALGSNVVGPAVNAAAPYYNPVNYYQAGKEMLTSTPAQIQRHRQMMDRQNTKEMALRRPPQPGLTSSPAIPPRPPTSKPATNTATRAPQVAVPQVKSTPAPTQPQQTPSAALPSVNMSLTPDFSRYQQQLQAPQATTQNLQPSQPKPAPQPQQPAQTAQAPRQSYQPKRNVYTQDPDGTHVYHDQYGIGRALTGAPTDLAKAPTHDQYKRYGPQNTVPPKAMVAGAKRPYPPTQYGL